MTLNLKKPTLEIGSNSFISLRDAPPTHQYATIETLFKFYSKLLQNFSTTSHIWQLSGFENFLCCENDATNLQVQRLLANVHKFALTKIRFVQFCPIFILSCVIPLVCSKRGSNGHADKPILICATNKVLQKFMAAPISKYWHTMWLASPLSYLMTAKYMAVPIFIFKYSLVLLMAPLYLLYWLYP